MKIKEFCNLNPKISQKYDDNLLVSFVPMANVSEDGEIITNDVRRYGELKKGFTYFENGDVLLAKITPCLENGKGAVAKNLKNNIGFGSTEFHVFRPNTSKVLSEWLYYFTHWEIFRKNCENNMMGSAGQKRISKTYLENYEVKLPDIKTQKEMVSVLDLTSHLISIKNQQLEQLDLLIKSRFVEMFGDVVINSKNWVIKHLEDISVSRLGKMLDSKQKTGQNLYPYLANFNVRWFGFDLTKLNEMDFNEEEQNEFKLEKGDLLVTEGGEIGRCAVWNGEIDNCFFQKALHRVRCNKNFILPIYLAWWFKFRCDYNKFEDIIGSLSTIAHLTGVKLKKLEIPLPPLALQTQFADFVTEVEQQKSTVKQSLDELGTLKASLMQQYFG